MSIFKDFFVKEKPVFTGITRGLGGFGFGAAGDGGGGASGFQASGGTKITSGDYTIHHFPCPSRTADAADNFIIAGSGTVDVCLIGAGGGGASGWPGSFSGGGGGAGAVVIKFNQSVTAQSYPIVTGHGSVPFGKTGTDRTPSGTNYDGSPSTALGLTGPGGGAGGGQGTAGNVGGSAGGPSHGATGDQDGDGVPYPGSGPLESPPAGWGNDSGAGASATFAAGGGGGAGADGSGRVGGAGIDLSPLFGTSLGVSGVFAGGGGGGTFGGGHNAGGSGGGGESGSNSPVTDGNGADGVLNTGSGGGGSDGSAPGPDTENWQYGGGGGGAPGIVIIRYLTSQIGT